MKTNDFLIKLGLVAAKSPSSEVVVVDSCGNYYHICDVSFSNNVTEVKIDQPICEDDGK